MVSPNTVRRVIESTPLGTLVKHIEENKFSFENNVDTHVEEQLKTGVFSISDNFYSSSFFFSLCGLSICQLNQTQPLANSAAEDLLIFSFSVWKAC